jgi:nitronate monooxygenase
MLRTRITERFGIRYPIMSAPMSGGHSNGRLAAAVSEAGGLGMFGGTHREGPDWVRQQIEYVRSRTDRPFGVGFITQFMPFFQENLRVALELNVPVIAFSFGDPTAWVAQAKGAGATVICQVQDMEGALIAEGAGSDVLVAQGNEAGGHTGTMSLLPFLARVVDRFKQLPVLAAGGIGDGRTFAEALASGADGAWLGTAFLASAESDATGAYKQRIVESNGEDTVFSEAFDIIDHAAFGIPEWPQGIGARAYRNRFAEEWHGRIDELRQRAEEIAPAYRDGVANNDPAYMTLLMGQSAAFVDGVRPAEAIIRSICDDAEALLRKRASDLLG